MTELTHVMRNFILHWGEMGSTWGINRTVAQIYATLYISPSPLTAEEISDLLSIARSTVSNGLHELQSWGVIRVVHVFGDRRDHFETMSDVWEMFRAILKERKCREIDPTLEILKQSVAELERQENENDYVSIRLKEMLSLFEVTSTVFEQVEQLPTDTLKRMAKIGKNLSDVLEKIVPKQ
jgi:DNA-binding transcriptional regulator GbsR (MarR family)